MKLFRRNRKNSLKQKEVELFDKMRNAKLSKADLLGKYEIPKTFKKLEELQNIGEIETQSIGFELWLDSPITPAPKDLIPFAITGGDGCYFAFITDYGNQNDLEKSPIAFISPTDFDDKKPKQSNFLFAKNLKDFLSLMTSLEYAEHIRFQNIYSPTINSILTNAIEEFNSEQSTKEKERKHKTKERLIKEFGLSEIYDYYEHFKSVKKIRNMQGHVSTMDGLNIYTKSKTEIKLINSESISEYASNFENEDKESILLAIRNAPFKFSYSHLDYGKYKVALIEVFDKLNLIREKRIQEFEIRMDKLLNEWMKVRKQINDER